MACFSYRGKSVFYEECGQGTPLVFLHGNTASSKLFLPILALYSGRYRCICPDFLGMGNPTGWRRFPRTCGRTKAGRSSRLSAISTAEKPAWRGPAAARGRL